MAGKEEQPQSLLTKPAQGIRDAAKYLIAGFGAIGAVLVANLSLTALPSGVHPVVAAVAVAIAVLALATMIGMAVSVLTPEAITLGKLAELQNRSPGSAVVKRLKEDEALFLGQNPDLVAFHRAYVVALKTRMEKENAYLDQVTPENETASRIADARVKFLDQAVGQILEVAVFYQLQDRFSRRRRATMTLLALVVVAGAAVFAWASSKPASSPEYLRGAVMVGADLHGANLKDADLREANLSRVNFKGANLASIKTDRLTTWTGTVCPDGTISRRAQDGCEGHLSP